MSSFHKLWIITDSPGSDTCQGDSGGSIDYKNKNNGRYYHLGIVSWGFGCAEINRPGVHVKMTNYLNWITAQTGNKIFIYLTLCESSFTWKHVWISNLHFSRYLHVFSWDNVLQAVSNSPQHPFFSKYKKVALTYTCHPV